MKEMIRELKNARDMLDGGVIACYDLERAMYRALIAVMERIDAMEQPPTRVEYIGTYSPQTAQEVKAIECAAMIKALRWAQKHVANPLDCHGYEMAITRLENGGEL